MSRDLEMSSSKLITKADSFLWGLIVMIPFGWIALWVNINRRRKEVEKGWRDSKSAATSIKNYVLGAVLGLVIMWCFLASQSSAYAQTAGKTVIVPNLIAIAILAISAAHNTSRINRVNLEHYDEDVDNVSRIDLDLDEYLLNIRLLKRHLEALDKDDENFATEMAAIKGEIDCLFKVYKDAEFPDGGKYRLYELRAEYYFMKNNKNLAKKNIEKAAEIKKEEEV